MPHGLFLEYLKDQRLQRLEPGLKQRLQAWDAARSGQLTERQNEALDDLLEHLQLLMEQYPEGPEPLDCDRRARFDSDVEEYSRLIRRAHRIGLSDHPLVREWMTITRPQQQLVETWNEKGLPFGKNPYVVPEILKALRKVHQGNLSLRGAYCRLKRDKILSVTYQAFHKSCCDNHFLRAVGVEEDQARWIINVQKIYSSDFRKAGVTLEHIEDQILYALNHKGPQDRTAISGLLGRHVPSRLIDFALGHLQRGGRIIIDRQQNPAGGRPRTIIRLVLRLRRRDPSLRLIRMRRNHSCITLNP